MEQEFAVPRITVNTGRTLTAMLPRKGDARTSLSARLNSVASRYDAVVRGACPELTFAQWGQILNINCGTMVNTSSALDDIPDAERRDWIAGDHPDALRAEIAIGLQSQAEMLGDPMLTGHCNPDDKAKAAKMAADLLALAAVAMGWDDAEVVAVAEINDRVWLRNDDGVGDLEKFLLSLGARIAEG